MAARKKALVRKGDIGYWIGKLGVITRVKFEDTVPNDRQGLTCWFEIDKQNPLGRNTSKTGKFGETVFSRLEDANAAARKKLDKAIRDDNAKLVRLREIANEPLALVGFGYKKKTVKAAAKD